MSKQPSTDTGGVGSGHPHPAWSPETGRGFLPGADPLMCLPEPFVAWEELAATLPKRLAAGNVRKAVEDLPPVDTAELIEPAPLERAMLLLSYFGHAYVWGERPVVARLPSSVAVPWYAVGARLGRAPVLSYASYALHNWRRVDVHRPIALGNIALLQNFLGGLDEEWFVLVHVEIEAKAAPGLAAIPALQQAVTADHQAAVVSGLATLATALEQIFHSLSRMAEGCDPYIYFRRVRPYIHGWKDHPALPAGMVYEGVEAYGGRPQQFRGETGAQSTIVPTMDAVLGIEHAEDPLRPYLLEMRQYMPPAHRRFLDQVEQAPSVRQYVVERRNDVDLRNAYNRAIHWLASFRSKHLEFADHYIFRQQQTDAANPTKVGTGGTPFMRYLKKHRDETLAHEIRP